MFVDGLTRFIKNKRDVIKNKEIIILDFNSSKEQEQELQHELYEKHIV